MKKREKMIDKKGGFHFSSLCEEKGKQLVKKKKLLHF